jgi:DNA primase
MVNQLLISLVNSVLGSGKKTARGNMAYTCPYCHHHKPKLEVNFTTNKEKVNPWHCWVCNKKGKSILQLLRQAGASQDKINEAKTFVKDTTYVSTKKDVVALKLPPEYKRLDQLNNNSIIKKHAIAYLKKRGVYLTDITKYDIGYCDKGLYENMIIIPTYNKEGRLNYFTARSFDKNAYVNLML